MENEGSNQNAIFRLGCVVHKKLSDARLESEQSKFAIKQFTATELEYLVSLVRTKVQDSENKRVRDEELQRQRTLTSERERVASVPLPRDYVCRKCGIPGHWITQCPLKQNRPPPGYVCHKCNTPGHWIEKCPKGANQVPPDGYICFKCQKRGHFIKFCPLNNNRQTSVSPNNMALPSPTQTTITANQQRPKPNERRIIRNLPRPQTTILRNPYMSGNEIMQNMGLNKLTKAVGKN